jgi:hypothetical protein
LIEKLEKISVSNAKISTFQEIKADFESNIENFELFWHSKQIDTLKDFGLLLL